MHQKNCSVFKNDNTSRLKRHGFAQGIHGFAHLQDFFVCAFIMFYQCFNLINEIFLHHFCIHSSTSILASKCLKFLDKSWLIIITGHNYDDYMHKFFMLIIIIKNNNRLYLQRVIHI